MTDLSECYHVALVGSKKGQSGVLEGFKVPRFRVPSSTPAEWTAYKHERSPIVWWVFEGSQGVGWNWTCVTGASSAIYRLEVSLNIRVDMVMPVLDFKKDVDAEAMKTTLRWQNKGRWVVVVVYSKQASRQSRWIGTTRLTAQWKDNGTLFQYCDWLSASDPNIFLFIHGGDAKLVEKLSIPLPQHLRNRPAKGTTAPIPISVGLTHSRSFGTAQTLAKL